MKYKFIDEIGKRLYELYDNIQSYMLRNSYELALVGVNENSILDDSNREDLSTKLSNAFFMSTKDPKKRRSSHLHNPTNDIIVRIKGRTVHISKKDIPKGVSKKKHLLDLGANEKEASRALKNCH